MISYEERKLKNVDLRSARIKIEEMENCLKVLSRENENLKRKFDTAEFESPDLLYNEIEHLRNTQISYKSNGEHKILRDSKVNFKSEKLSENCKNGDFNFKIEKISRKDSYKKTGKKNPVIDLNF